VQGTDYYYSMTTFKLFFGDEDIRRVTLAVPDWDSFNRELVTLYPQQFHPELRVTYKDEEGDLITISTEKEWQLMLETSQESVKKLYIAEGKHAGKYFKDGPPAAAVGAYTEEQGEKKPVEEEEVIKKLEFAVPRCLERLLPGGKLTPYNLPSWLQGCVEVKRVPGVDPTVDLDVNVGSLFDSLHKQALELIRPDAEPQLLRRAKEFLQSMIDLAPQNPLPHYNLACAEALLGEVTESIASLKTAIEVGYSNLSHMIQDTDLNILHNLPEFQDLVEMLRQKVQPKKEEEKKEEEPKAEEVPEVKEEKQAEPEVTIVKEEPVPEVKEVKEEEKKEEKKEEQKPPSRWATQLEALAAMGFENAEVNEALLKEYKGDIVKVVNSLLFAQ